MRPRGDAPRAFADEANVSVVGLGIFGGVEGDDREFGGGGFRSDEGAAVRRIQRGTRPSIAVRSLVECAAFPSPKRLST